MNKRLFLNLIFISIIILSLLPGCGGGGNSGGGGWDNTGNVTGTVTDNNGNPVEGVSCQVTVSDAKGKEVYSDTTDAEGNFSIVGVPEGNWYLMIAASGYQTLSIPVSVVAGMTTAVPENHTVISPGTTGTVQGTVTDITNELPLEDASISVGGIADSSGESGFYSIENVPSGEQTITATILSYRDYSSTVTVIEDQTVIHNIALTPLEIPEPDPGKGHVEGQVVDSNGNNLSGVTCSITEKGKATITTQTNSLGRYILQNITPGLQNITLTKSGYDTASVEVNVVESQTVTASQVTLSSAPTSGTTVLCSIPRITENNAGEGSKNASVCDMGNLVSFESNEHLLATHITNSWHIYLFRRSSGTVTLIDKSPDGLEGSADGNPCDSRNSRIAGDGGYIAFDSNAGNLLGSGIDLNKSRDIFRYNISTGTIIRVSADTDNQSEGGYVTPFGGGTPIGANSSHPSISRDGSFISYQSEADNLVLQSYYSSNHAASAGSYNVNIYLAQISTSGTITTKMISQRKAGGECNPADWGGVRRISEKSYLSRNGRYISYQSNAFKGSNFVGNSGDALTDTSGARDGQDDRDIVLCDTLESVDGWNTMVSMNINGQLQPTGTSPCVNSSLSDDSVYVAFECVDTGLWEMNDGLFDIWMKNTETGELKLLSYTSSGVRGDSKNGNLSRDGVYIAFNSASNGFVENDTNNAVDCFIRNISTGVIKRVNLSSNAEQSEPTASGSLRPVISGNDDYVVFESDAKNLTSNIFFSAGVYDVYLRKWR